MLCHEDKSEPDFGSPSPLQHFSTGWKRVLFCFVLFALQLSVCLWWHDYRRDDFPTLKFGVVLADLLAIC